MPPIRRIPSLWIVSAALLVTLAIYWVGLGGPYLLDDVTILASVDRWHADQQSWQITLVPNSESFVNSRPVAMASFMLGSWLGGPGTFALKLGNLLVHMLCGLLGWWLLRRIFWMDASLARRADLYAAVAAAIWLLHPLHVSTVLYAVQRMAQLAALFTLAAVSIYLVARQQLREGRTRAAAANLFISFPLLWTFGILSKQNAMIAPMLCLALEFAYFRRIANQRDLLAGFFGLFAAAPILIAVVLLVLAPESLLAGYAELDFTVGQRLLTQPRALLDYIGMWFLPRGPQMGLYTDAYPVSTGLLSPPETLLSIVTLAMVSSFAIAVRRRAPSVFAGWIFFLVAHAVESSFLPLDLYYEHRNYLPAFGLLIAAFGFLALLPDGSRIYRLNTLRMKAAAGAALLSVLAFATHGRVSVWQHEELIIAQGLEQHPRSLAARLDMISLTLRSDDLVRAKALNDPLLESDDPRERMVANLLSVAIVCLEGGSHGQDYLQEAIANAQPKLMRSELRLVRTLYNLTEDRTCGNVDDDALGDAVSRLATKATGQDEGTPAKHLTRSYASRLYIRAEEWEKAEHQARLAWEGGQRLPEAALLARIYLHNGEPGAAQPLVDMLAEQVDPHNRSGQAEVTELKRIVAAQNRQRTLRHSSSHGTFFEKEGAAE